MPWAILSLRGRAEQETLLTLCEHGGLPSIERAAKLFAACDTDRDGVLLDAELFTAVSALRQEMEANEAALPDGAPDAPATDYYRDVCEERLHEISLLRLLVPDASLSTMTVTAMATAAAGQARGSAAVRRQAAAAFMADALVAERNRAQAAAAHAGGVQLLPFLGSFLRLASELEVAQVVVRTLADKHARHEEEADSQALLAAGVGRGVDAHLQLFGRLPASQQADASSSTGAVEGALVDDGARSSGTADAAGHGKRDARGALSFRSGWQPGVEMQYFEQRKKRQVRNVGTMLSLMAPD